MSGERRFTQVGTVTILLFAVSAAFIAFVVVSAVQSGDGPPPAVVGAIGVVVAVGFILGLAAFHSFTIQIGSETVSFWFGLGLAKRTLPIAAIVSVEIVRNPWYYLWGIETIPGGWLYSVAPGVRTIELELKDHLKIRLGTDRPEEVKRSLQLAMERH